MTWAITGDGHSSMAVQAASIAAKLRSTSSGAASHPLTDVGTRTEGASQAVEDDSPQFGMTRQLAEDALHARPAGAGQRVAALTGAHGDPGQPPLPLQPEARGLVGGRSSHRARAVQGGHLVRVVAKLGEHLVGVLPSVRRGRRAVAAGRRA